MSVYQELTIKSNYDTLYLITKRYGGNHHAGQQAGDLSHRGPAGELHPGANELHITQPAVTQHMRKLEEYYGCRLIDFTGHQLRLTAAGELLLRYGTLQQANERSMLEQMEGVSRTLRVGATLSIADYYLPALLGPHLGEQGWGLSLQVGNTEEMLDRCARGELDCAFIEGMFGGEDFCRRVLLTEDFLPVAGAGHPLAGRACTLEELFAYPLVLREKGSGTRAILENHLFQQGRTPEAFAQVLECGSFQMIKEILRRTQAVSFLYRGVARKEAEAGELVWLEAEGFSIRRPLYFAYPKNSMNRRSCEAFFRRVAGEG